MEQNTALLVMDMQTGILGGYPQFALLTDMVNKAIIIARKKNIPVIFVVVGFRRGAPEISPNNKSFSSRKDGFANINMDEFMTVAPAITKQDKDIIVIKRRVSAFTGSDLEVVLRGLNIQHLVLTGIATSGVVLSTIREASDKDYRLTVLADCCGDPDEETHRVLTTKVFTRQAEVLNIDNWS
ncbi:nicotinamidase-related amidase [Mucilaginibacter frigoritolerans]|uniref:Nicotinamidase-related amidase n=1 Tax=Mucilaginibacter frigoritolerans TaxID=652788 RepID=A0A562TX97_9SPHI|nr:isochorismatase family cysteine hydrolase [Mucilaginibacter frigoritolerans]TWI98185.1 nicotinamidase-related amidase [Mucilaginibacter frigoritolerans]